METTRRRFLRSGWKLGGALLAVAAGWTAYESLRPLSSATQGSRLELGNPADLAPGEAKSFPEGRLYLANAGGSYFALSQKCTHLGCRVPFCDSSGRFECPCHGSVFDIGGEWVGGPAPRGLDRYELHLEGSTLIADTRVLIKGPLRGSQQFLTPPRGPSCIGSS